MSLLENIKAASSQFLWTPSQVGWGPGEPIRPAAQNEPIRREDYLPSRNIMFTPRAAESRAVSYAQMRNLADNYGVLRTVIEKRKDEMVGLEWKIEVKPEFTGNPQYEADARDEQRFWERPDGEHSFDSWLRTVLEDDFVIDASTLYKNFDRVGRLQSLDIVDGSTILVLVDDKGRVPASPETAYEQVIKGQPRTGWTRDEIIYNPYCLRSNGVYGFSHVESIIMTINIALRRDISMLEWFRSGNIPQGLIQMPETWTPDQITAAQSILDNLLAGDLAARAKLHAIPGVNGVVQLQQLTFDAVFDEWLARIVCARFGVSPAPYVRGMNRAEAQTVEDAATEESLVPMMQHKKKLFDAIIANDRKRPHLHFVWVSKGAHYRKEDALINQMMVHDGAQTIDDWLRDKGRPPLPNGLGARHLVWTGSGPVMLEDILSGKYQASQSGQLGIGDQGGNSGLGDFALSLGNDFNRPTVKQEISKDKSPYELEIEANKAVKAQDVNLSCKVIIRSGIDGAVLLLKDARSEYWDLPGGHVQDGETPEAALKREVREETGLDFGRVRRLGARELVLGGEPRVVLFYECTCELSDTDAVQLSGEHTGYEWVTADDIANYNVGVFRPVICPIAPERENSRLFNETEVRAAADGLKAELAAWEKFSVNRLGKKIVREFAVKSLPLAVAQAIRSQLPNCQTAEAVKAVFDNARQSLISRPRTPNVRRGLDQMIADYEQVLLGAMNKAKDKA